MYITELDWNRFFTLAVLRRGFDFRLYRPYQLKRRIVQFMEHESLQTLSELWAHINEGESNYTHFLSDLSINVSEFFRDPKHWKTLEQEVIPSLLNQFSEINAWSAGCSYGAEAYSLAMLLKKRGNAPYQILGTDICQPALTKAKEGIFSDHDLQGMPEKYKKSYMMQVNKEWRIVPDIKLKVQFMLQDVFKSHQQNSYHLIICRNLAIYLTREAQDQLYQILYNALHPGGVLFIGSTERIVKYREIGFKPFHSFFYQKPIEEI